MIGKGKKVDNLYVINSEKFQDQDEGLYSVTSFCNVSSVANNVNA